MRKKRYTCAMTSNLRPRKAPSPPPPLTAERLREVIGDIGTGAGWYVSGDLYRWYLSVCQEDGVLPVTHNAFGRALRSFGCRSEMRRVSGELCRCWFVPKKVVEGP
jgi:hypothetical protein